MKITKAIRKEISPFLPLQYRIIVVERLQARGIKVHPNTVSNVYKHGNENAVVANELIALAAEYKRMEMQSIKTMRQLSAA